MQYLRVMGFDEHFDGQAANRLAALRPNAYTRMGAAIRHATTVLAQRSGTARRLLIVISDGFAYDHGYERAYGEADSRRALTEARNLGIGCVCLSVGARTDALALRRVFGTAAHAAIDDPTNCRPSSEGSSRSPSRRGRQHRDIPATGPLRRAPSCRKDGFMSSDRPFYIPVGNEERVFKAAYRQGLAILLKGPTGCGKTRFVEAMAHDLGRPLITVACHDDLTTADLVGRFLLQGGDTNWVDGPLTRAVREGAICYLDEIVEARQDTTVVLHPLADHRRQTADRPPRLTLDAAEGFCLVVSYNPGYQSVMKDLKDSTRQRMVAIELDFPPVDVEEKVVVAESGVEAATAAQLVGVAQAIRRLDRSGLREVASTRVLIAAGRLVRRGTAARRSGPGGRGGTADRRPPDHSGAGGDFSMRIWEGQRRLTLEAGRGSVRNKYQVSADPRLVGPAEGGGVSYESTAEPIRLGYLMDFKLPEGYPEEMPVVISCCPSRSCSPRRCARADRPPRRARAPGGGGVAQGLGEGGHRRLWRTRRRGLSGRVRPAYHRQLRAHPRSDRATL